MVRQRTFDESSLKQVAKEISLVEAKTSGEIVVVTVPRSSDYAWVPLVWGAIGWALASALLCVLFVGWHYDLSISMILESQLGTVVLFYLLGRYPSLLRRSIPKKEAASLVHEAALAHFTVRGLCETRDRTGILIYISELEHRIEILADRGIHSVVGETYWEDQVRHIVEGIRRDRAGEALCEAIRQMGEKLAALFPARHDDTNELGNEVHTGASDPKVPEK